MRSKVTRLVCACVISLAGVSLLGSLAVGQTKSAPGQRTAPPDPGATESATQKQARQQLLVRIGDVLRSTSEDARQWKDAAAASDVLSKIADLLWVSDSQIARNYLAQAWEKAGHVDEHKQERSRFRNQSARNDARRDVMLVARRRAPDLAKKWLEQMTQEAEEEREAEPRGTYDDRTARSAVLLQMALQTAESNPQAAAELAIESLRDGISFGFQETLIKLQEKEFNIAQSVFRAALQRLRTVGLIDPNELLILYSYLYTPGRIAAADIGDNSASRQLAVSQNRPRITAAARLNPALAMEFLSLAADLLITAPLPTTSADPQVTARTQLSVINYLLNEVTVQLPEKAAALQARAQQIVADARFSTIPRPPSPDRPAPLEGESLQGYAERRVDVLEQQAEKETDTLSRDIAYARAALATTLENYERGFSLAGKVQDESLRSGVTNWLVYRAVLHLIKAGDFVKAYALNAKNSDPLQRAIGLVVGAQKSVKEKDIIRSRQWLEESRELIRKAAPSDQRSRIAFGVVSTYGFFDKAIALQSLSDVVLSLEQSSPATGRDERAPLIKQFSGLNTSSDFTYGTSGFSLMAAIKTFDADQFEDVLYLFNKIPSREVRGQALVTLCQEYLQRKEKSSGKTVNPPAAKSG